ncbi:MAG: hypothetical protein KDL87_07040 [Verrucomicrobiae bacterium]|nr:hypothetical protein [Verrucomicrobiae bacterium]
MPLFVFCLVSMVTGEFYPFSPFSMYSNPSPVPLRFCYVADGEGEPLPILWHTGVSPASLTKKYGHHRGEIEEAIGRKERPEMTDEEVRAEAGLEVLKWLRNLSMNRAKRELTDPLQLVEISVSTDGHGLTETSRAVAELE